MDPHAAPPNASVSNLVASWGEDGGSFQPASAATVVEQAVHADSERPTRLVSPPERFDAIEPVEAPSAYSYALADPERDEDDLPIVDYDALRRRDIAKELLRVRLVAIAEQREHRSAYEIVFILLAASVAILLAAPPLVQVLLAAHGVQG